MDSAESTCDDSLGLSAEDMMARDFASSEWTDEKHSLYLKSMETSFVNQLYKSMHLGDYSHLTFSNTRSLQQHDRCNNPCEFKVLRNGCWDTAKLHNQKCASNSCHVLLKNPWIQHFRPSQKSGTYTSLTIQKPSSPPVPNLCSKNSHSRKSNLRIHHAIDCNGGASVDIEVSDQNFVDEHNEESKAPKRCSGKRIKTASDASYSDQVVPFDKKAPVMTDIN